MRRLPQAAYVTIVEKWLAIVGAQRLVDTFAVDESVIVDRDDRMLGIRNLSVDKNRPAHIARSLTYAYCWLNEDHRVGESNCLAPRMAERETLNQTPNRRTLNQTPNRRTPNPEPESKG